MMHNATTPERMIAFGVLAPVTTRRAAAGRRALRDS